MRIVVVGASVSAQRIHHATQEVTGYCEVLRREYLSALGVTELVQATYPGNRFSDAGLILLRDVIALKPDVCIVEPLIEDSSRGVDPTRCEITYFYSELINADIRPIALFLPEPLSANPSPKAVKGYELHAQICRDLSIQTIEIDLTGTPDLESKFVGVHTRLAGARVYAKEIAERLPKFDLTSPLHVSPTTSEIFISSATFQPCSRLRHVQLQIEAERPTALRIIQKQSIGPHSPLLDISKFTGQTRENSEISVWDPYCHYPRDSYVNLFNGHVEAGSTLITAVCSRKPPAHTRSVHHRENWPSPAEKMLIPLSDFFLISNGPVSAARLF